MSASSQTISDRRQPINSDLSIIRDTTIETKTLISAHIISDDKFQISIYEKLKDQDTRSAAQHIENVKNIGETNNKVGRVVDDLNKKIDDTYRSLDNKIEGVKVTLTNQINENTKEITGTLRYGAKLILSVAGALIMILLSVAGYLLSTGAHLEQHPAPSSDQQAPALSSTVKRK